MSTLALACMLQTSLRADTTIVVSSTDDDLALNGNCTLREAVIGANTNTAVDSCAAGSGADTIVLPAGTYVLTLAGPGENASHTGDLDILSDITIRGTGAETTIIDGGSLEDPFADRVLNVLSAGTLTISGVTVRGGHCRSGAGIFNAGKLLVQDSRIVSNVTSDRFFSCWSSEAGGGGVFNRGDATISHSIVSGNVALGYTGYSDADVPGGGVLNIQSAHIDLSTLSGNWSAAGGAVFNRGAVQMTDSFVAENGARFWGSALENDGLASVIRTTVTNNYESAIVNGGLNGRAPRLRLENSTVSDNSSYRLMGAIVNVAGETKVTWSTVADNQTQGIIGYMNTAVVLMNSIVAGNGDADCTGVMTSLGYNLDRDGTCGLHQQGDLPNSDPHLAALADNGGPVPTRALLPGSVAIDHIPLLRCKVIVDERGLSRAGGACDIGAFESSGVSLSGGSR